MRKSFVLSQLGPDLGYFVHNSSIENSSRAVLERILYVKITDDDGTEHWVEPPLPLSKEHFFSNLRDFYKSLVAAIPTTSSWTVDRFVNSYTGRKKAVYQKAAESLEHIQVSRKDSIVRVFVKAEKTTKPTPRAISPRDPRFNTELGLFIKPAEPLVYKAIAIVCGSRVVVFKGMNAEQQAAALREKWEMFARPVCVCVDAKRFDEHISRIALMYEHSVYLRMFRGDKKLKRLLSWQLETIGVCYCRDGKLRFKTPGKRCSGDMNTAVGNCLVMSSMVVSYAKFKGVRIELANNGDDCAIIMEAEDERNFLDGLEKWFLDMGFTMVVEPSVTEFERIDFCQTRPVFDGKKWIMVRHWTAFAKDCLSIKPLDNPGVFYKWMMAVGKGGLSLTGQIPMWQEFYSAILRSAEAHPYKSKRPNRITDDPTFETGMAMLSKGMGRVYGDICHEARFSFWKAFGITPEEQIEAEKYYRSQTLTLHDPNFRVPEYMAAFPLGN